MIARFAPLAPVALLLVACGGADDASEDAMVDTVEMPADEAMANAPMPVEDRDFAGEDDLAGSDPAARSEPTTEAVERTAEQAAEDAQSAVDDALAAAEAEME